MLKASNVILVLIALLLFFIGFKINKHVKRNNRKKIQKKKKESKPIVGMFLTKEVMEYIFQEETSSCRVSDVFCCEHQDGPLEPEFDIEMQSAFS